MTDYVPKTEPWLHQARTFVDSRDVPAHALLMEPRTGKSKVVIDTAAYQYELGAITALLIVAEPSGVPRNWATDEIPAHLPDRVPRMVHVWDAARFARRATQEELERLLNFRGLAVLCVKGQATILTQNFRRYCARFLKVRQRVMLVGDETTLFCKTPGSKQTKVMTAIADRPEVRFKRILDGTPALESPLDLHAQFRVLGPGLLGARTFAEYKARYAIYEDRRVYDPKTGQSRAYPELQGFQDLEGLRDLMDAHSTIVTRRDAFPNMPAQVVCPLYLTLSREQRRVYDAIRSEHEAELGDGGLLTVTNVLTRYMRLQQIASNRIPSRRVLTFCPACRGDGCEGCDGLGALEAHEPERLVDPDNNPRLEALEDQLSRTREPFIVWCRFTGDVDDAFALCERLRLAPVRYDGRVSGEQKAENKRAFQEGRAGAFVGNPVSGGRGLTLRAARTIFNYSHFFSLMTYVQGNDRAEDPEATRGTSVVDLVAEDTVDEDIALAHAAKQSLSDLLMKRKRETGSWS